MLFRIAQEALANVARHSKATAVYISLLQNKESVHLTLSDNGQGFLVPKGQNGGIGLRSMRSRIEAVGGQIEVNSQTDKGTQIMVSCEYKDKGVRIEREESLI